MYGLKYYVEPERKSLIIYSFWEPLFILCHALTRKLRRTNTFSQPQTSKREREHVRRVQHKLFGMT